MQEKGSPTSSTSSNHQVISDNSEKKNDQNGDQVYWKEQEQEQEQGDEEGPVVKWLKCPYCPKMFPNAQALGGHQNAHRGLRHEAKRGNHALSRSSRRMSARIRASLNFDPQTQKSVVRAGCGSATASQEGAPQLNPGFTTYGPPTTMVQPRFGSEPGYGSLPAAGINEHGALCYRPSNIESGLAHGHGFMAAAATETQKLPAALGNEAMHETAGIGRGSDAASDHQPQISGGGSYYYYHSYNLMLPIEGRSYYDDPHHQVPIVDNDPTPCELNLLRPREVSLAMSQNGRLLGSWDEEAEARSKGLDLKLSL